ncbi:MAG: extracellular solute-binding protein [Nitriliruptorales bacterium]|nr:extracellular solute-binding protein [Nitriliruptorales bacterium]
MRHPLLMALAAGALMVAVTGCGLAARGAGELTIYSGRSRDLVEPLLNQFAEDTGIPIAVKYGDSTELALLLAEEGPRSPADVFLSQSPGTVGFLAQQDLLARLPDDVTAQVPDAHRSADDRWVGVTARQRVLVYNRDDVATRDLPTSVLDLTDPEHRGRVAVAPSNASFQDFVTAMRQQVGDERTLAWLEGMAANGSPVYANNNAIVEAVGRGEVPMGLVNHYYNERFLDENPSLPSRNHRFADGDLGSLVIESSVSIMAASDQREQGREFVEYLLGETAQRYFAEETFEYPLVEGVDPAGDLPALSELEPPTVDVDALAGGFVGTQDMIERSGIAD